MPDSRQVDERVAVFRMDNENFEKGAEKTISTIEKLKDHLQFKDTKLGDLGTSAVEKGLDVVKTKFDALQIAGKRAIENITDSAMNMVKQAITGADQIMPGYNKYEQQIQAVQKLIIATGEGMDAVQAISDKILRFTDETSYEYASMMSTMASFTSSGMGLEDAANTIIGIAVAAGQAGVSATDATHAFMGFQKAMGGSMSATNWEWIKTAHMDTAELKRQLLEAAAACGTLAKGADGVYYAMEQTKSGVKQTAVTIENFDQTFSEKWLTGDVIKRGMSNYAKAFNQIEEIAKQLDLEIYEVLNREDLRELLDQYSLDAFEAGQQTKTWSDAVGALKAAVSSGWMKSFELMIGNFKQASDFFTQLIEPLYDIFVNPGKKRNQFLEAAFGGGNGGELTKTVASWDKLKKKIDETGHSVEELQKAYDQVINESEDAEVKTLAEKYKDLEEAIRDGAVSGDLLQEVLTKIGGTSKSATDEMVKGAKDAAQALDEYKRVAQQYNAGKYGSGNESRKQIEAMGMDFDVVKMLAGNLRNGKGFDAVTLKWFETTAPNLYKKFIQAIADGNVVIDEATGELIQLGDVVDKVDLELEQRIAAMSGRELWQGGVLNIVEAFAAAFGKIGEAFDKVFGDAEKRGKDFRGLLESFYRTTEKLKNNEATLEKIRQFFEGVFKTLGKLPKILLNIGTASVPILKTIRTILSTIGKLRKPLMAIIDKVLGLFTKNENVNEEFGTLGSILEKLGIIFGKLSNKVEKYLGPLDKIFDNFVKKIQNFSFSEFFKPLTDFLNSDNPIAKLIRTITKPFEDLFGGNGTGKDGILGSLTGFLSGFSQSSDDVSGSIDRLQTSVGGLSGVLEKIVKIPQALMDGLNSDDASAKEKIHTMWENLKKIIAEEYKKIEWNDVLEAGKLGLFGLMIYRLNEFFKNINKAVKAPKTSLQSVANAITGFTGAITGPFKALSTAITKGEQANRYLKIATAIGVLAASIYLLCQVDTDKFLNVAMAMGILLAIMAKLAKNMDGFQLFSNNNKTISKNNPVQNTIKAFENLKSAFSVNMSGAKFNVNLLSNTMQVMIGIAVMITAVVNAFNKLRDIKSLEEVKPAIILLGGIMAALTIMTPLFALLSREAQYAGAVGMMMVGIAAALAIMVNSLIKIGKMTTEGQLNWPAIQRMFFIMIAMMAAIAVIAKISTGFVKQGESLFSSGAAVLAIGGVFLALGLLVKMLVKSLAKASEIENLTKAVVIMAALFIAISTVFAIMSFLAGQKEGGAGDMLKVAASMVILAAALLILVPAIAIMSALPAAGLIAAAAALGILVLALSGAMAIISKLDPSKMIKLSAAFLLFSIGMALMSAAILGFNLAMIAIVSVVPWDQVSAKFKQFRDAMDIIIPTLQTLALLAVVFGAAFLAAGIGIAKIGVGFLTASLGLLLFSVALRVMVGAMDVFAKALPGFFKGLVEAYDTIDQNGWKVIVMLTLITVVLIGVAMAIKALAGEDTKETLKNLGTNLETAITQVMKAMQAASPKLLAALASFAGLIATFLIALIPFAVTSVVAIIVKFIYAIADSISANSAQIIAAFEALFGTLIALALKALNTVIGDLLAFFGELIVSILDTMIPGVGKKVRDKLGRNFASWTENGVSALNTLVDDAIDKTFMSHRRELETEIPIVPSVSAELENDPNYQAAAAEMKESLGDLGHTSGENMGEETKKGFLETLVGGEDGGIGGLATDALSTSMLGAAGEDNGVQGVIDTMLGDSLGSSETMDIAGDFGSDTSSSWLSSLKTSLIDPGNTDSTKTSILDFLSGTFGSDDTKQAFSDSGFELGETTATETANGLKSSDSTVRLQRAASSANNQTANGWNRQASINAPYMINALISGLERAVYYSSGVTSRLNAIGAEIYSQMEAGMKAQAGIASPSKAMEQNGRYMVQGLVLGMSSGENDVYGIGSTISSDILGVFQSAIAQIAAMMDGNFNYEPTITPVVDMSNVQAAADWMSGKFNSHYGVTPEMDNRIQNIENYRNRARTNMSSSQPSTTGSPAVPGDSVVINVYPSPGMDENKLADAVMLRMASRMTRRRAAMGT